MSLPPELRLPLDPDASRARPENVIEGERYRISLLDAGLVRLEYSPDGVFEDRPSQVVLTRDLPPVEAAVRRDGAAVDVRTSRLHLSYDGGPFTASGLKVQVEGGISTWHSVWRYGEDGDAAAGNLGGTARTLDGVDGAVELEPGILSRNGVSVLDDSDSLLLTDTGWFAGRRPGNLDLYVFAFGRDYTDALRVFHAVTGKTPVLPRFALGNWWSRYHAYSAAEYEALFDRFEAERLPFSVAVLDMDWHHVDIDPRLGSGWTGYSWNRDLFPDPPAFLDGLHRRGLAVTLNVHPADGIRPHEDAYAAMARRRDIDPDSEVPVDFDAADPEFLTAYLEEVHHPREREGVDFWWLDWQQGPFSRMPGLDPLWVLNHVHFLDSARQGRLERPLTFSRYAGPGSHRYPVGFSGDSVTSWASLAFQPRFTASAANIGYGWWSHDVGGHFEGVKDDELATRWVQLGVFSPLLRLHSTHDPFNSKEPWRFGEVARRVMGEQLRLRHRLVPYLHTMNRRAHVDDVALVRPMYHEFPWNDGAYEVPGQFLFGSQFVVAAITQPRDPATTLGRVEAWIPEGEWVDVFTGLTYGAPRGGRRALLHRDIDSIPVLARAGAVVPVAGGEALDTANPSSLEVWVVAGADGRFTLAEDRADSWAFTPLSYDAAAGEVVVGAVEGDAAVVPDDRHISLVLVGFSEVTSVRVGSRSVAVERDAAGRVRADLGAYDPATGVRAVLDGDLSLAANDVPTRVFDLLDRAQIEFATKNAVRAAFERSATPAAALLELDALGIPDALRTALAEVALAR